MTKETWLPVKGFGGRYEVSDQGNIRSFGKRILKQYTHKFGYKIVYLYEVDKSIRKRKCSRVHRLMAEAFIPNPDNLRDVNHIDGIKNHNVLSNFEWVSRSDNVKHAFKLGLKNSDTVQGTNNRLAKLDDNAVKYIRANKGLVSQRKLANMFGVSQSTLQIAQSGKSWKHI